MDSSLPAENEWNEERLRAEVLGRLGRDRLCIIANREPYLHEWRQGRIQVTTPASGLVTALEPVVRPSAGLWIAHGSGSADRAATGERGLIRVPPGVGSYDLKRVWLSDEEEEGYYYGFANEGLWPLCHVVHTRPLFRASDWAQYLRVNARFADAFVAEVPGPRPTVLIQDYHFAPLPELIRARRPEAAISLFWHIPWSGPDVTRICPWKTELLQGMLGADLLGFQTQYHCNNFFDCVDRFLEALVDRERFCVTMRGHTCFVKPFPISIEWPSRHAVPADRVPAARAELLAELGLEPSALLGLGVDRIDYTKGIVERFLAIEALLARRPELVGRFTFVQIGAPSRTRIPRYRAFLGEVRDTAERINDRFARSPQPPILLRLFRHDAAAITRFYQAADVCVVNSLHDGMNLVAKEYVASRTDEGGALVLSNFTGAARELIEAFIVNPYDIEGTAAAIHEALTAPGSVRHERMRRMRETVRRNNVYVWAKALLEETLRSARLRDESMGSAERMRVAS